MTRDEYHVLFDGQIKYGIQNYSTGRKCGLLRARKINRGRYADQ